MSTAARKARKRSGEKFSKAPKTATPPMERGYVTQPVPGAPGTKFVSSFNGYSRSAKKIKRFMEHRTVEEASA